MNQLIYLWTVLPLHQSSTTIWWCQTSHTGLHPFGLANTKILSLRINLLLWSSACESFTTKRTYTSWGDVFGSLFPRSTVLQTSSSGSISSINTRITRTCVFFGSVCSSSLQQTVQIISTQVQTSFRWCNCWHGFSLGHSWRDWNPTRCFVGIIGSHEPWNSYEPTQWNKMCVVNSGWILM